MNMNKLFQTSTRDDYLDIVILILRLSIAALMLVHGLPKLSGLLAGGEIEFADPIGVGAAASLIFAVFAEVFCSILIGIGLLTRLATIPLIIMLILAALVINGPGIGEKELAFLYLLIYLVILVVGGRKFSLDHILSKKIT